MFELSLQERARRLKEYSETIAGDAPVESVYSEFSQDTMGLETVPKTRLKRAADAVRRSAAGDELSADDIVAAEAIIHRTKRPSRLIKDNRFESFSGEFRYMTEDDQVKNNIGDAIPAVGRIDLPKHPTTYAGTGFVVGRNLVMTNRHVAQLFVSGAGREQLRLNMWQDGEIDLKREYGDAAAGFRITKCVMIHPYWDMAVFEADLPTTVTPLTLTIERYEDILLRDIVVIGYPAFDPERNDPDVQHEIFDGKYNVKRIAPGRIVQRRREISSRWLSTGVAALAHDSSTLGGNSGSVVLDVKSGRVAALHFAGRYMIENYGVPGHELARDPRVVDSGVQFEHPVPDANRDLDPYWSAVEEEPPLTAPVPGGKPATIVQSPRHTGVTLNAGDRSLEIPLHISVSLGVAGTAPREPAVHFASSMGSGYDASFLSESVPTPKLTPPIADDIFRLDGSDLIPYTHFSVCQRKSRALPQFVAWNIDGDRIKKVSRKGIKFVSDPRVPDKFQADDSLYKNNPLDRGHIARRADLTWGPLSEAKQANRDSFFFTNITPQHEAFNQSGKGGLWGELENAIMEDIEVEDLRVSVIAGPIFRNDDPRHRGIQIPREYWKLIAFRDTSDDEFKVAAYILSQKELVPAEVLELDPFHLFQVSLTKLGNETELNFDALSSFDAAVTETVADSGVREVRSREDVAMF